MLAARILIVSFLLIWIQLPTLNYNTICAAPAYKTTNNNTALPIEPIEPIDGQTKTTKKKKHKRTSPIKKQSKQDKYYNVWVVFFILAFLMMVPLILFLVHYLKGNMAIWVTMFVIMLAYYVSGLITAIFTKGKPLSGLLIFSAIAGLLCIAFGFANTLKIIWVGGLILLALAIVILLDSVRGAIKATKTPIK